MIEYAKAKLTGKNLDLIIANDVSDSNIGFNSNQNKVTLIYKDLTIEDIPLMDKTELANILINKIETTFGNNKK